MIFIIKIWRLYAKKGIILTDWPARYRSRINAGHELGRNGVCKHMIDWWISNPMPSEVWDGISYPFQTL